MKDDTIPGSTGIWAAVALIATWAWLAVSSAGRTAQLGALRAELNAPRPETAAEASAADAAERLPDIVQQPRLWTYLAALDGGEVRFDWLLREGGTFVATATAWAGDREKFAVSAEGAWRIKGSALAQALTLAVVGRALVSRFGGRAVATGPHHGGRARRLSECGRPKRMNPAASRAGGAANGGLSALLLIVALGGAGTRLAAAAVETGIEGRWSCRLQVRYTEGERDYRAKWAFDATSRKSTVRWYPARVIETYTYRWDGRTLDLISGETGRAHSFAAYLDARHQIVIDMPRLRSRGFVCAREG